MRFLLRFAHDTWRAKTAIIARTPFSRIRISSTAIGRARCDLPQVVPGTCDYPQRCWNQRDYSFEAAIWAAFELQVTMRGRRPPYQFQAINGGQFRQVNRESLEIHTEQLGRLPSKRDSEAALWDSLISRPSTLRRYAVEVREEVCRVKAQAAMRGRSLRGHSPQRASSRPPMASWTNSRPATPSRGGGSSHKPRVIVENNAEARQTWRRWSLRLPRRTL